MLKQEKDKNPELGQAARAEQENGDENELLPGRMPSNAFLAALKAVEDIFGG